jgi:uncharacterized membrane-anchored protein
MVSNAVHPRVELAAHPLRELLNDEFHARPPLPLTSPVLVSHLVLTQDPAVLAGERNRLCRLAQTHAGKLLTSSDTCLVFDGGPFLLRWELHTEFSSYTVFRSLPPGEPRNAEATALDVLPTEWLRTLPGQMIVATHVELRSSGELSPQSVTASLTPTGRQMVAAQVADRAAWVFTDFIFDQGFSRFVVLDVSLTQRQAGRTVQRLLEIETYRLLALLALPVAKEVGGWLTGAESSWPKWLIISARPTRRPMNARCSPI